MKKTTFLLLVLTISMVSMAESLLSPDKNFRLDFSVNPAGEPVYGLFYKEKPVIKTSKLGLELKNAPSLLAGFNIQKTATSTFDETW